MAHVTLTSKCEGHDKIALLNRGNDVRPSRLCDLFSSALDCSFNLSSHILDIAYKTFRHKK